MSEEWERGDLVKLLFTQKAKYERNIAGWGINKWKKWERQGLGNKQNGVKSFISDRWLGMGTQQEQRCRRVLQTIAGISR